MKFITPFLWGMGIIAGCNKIDSSIIPTKKTVPAAKIIGVAKPTKYADTLKTTLNDIILHRFSSNSDFMGFIQILEANILKNEKGNHVNTGDVFGKVTDDASKMAILVHPFGTPSLYTTCLGVLPGYYQGQYRAINTAAAPVDFTMSYNDNNPVAYSTPKDNPLDTTFYNQIKADLKTGSAILEYSLKPGQLNMDDGQGPYSNQRTYTTYFVLDKDWDFEQNGQHIVVPAKRILTHKPAVSLGLK